MVAREIGIAKVIIPRAPGHFSAVGMLLADLRRDFVSTWFKPLASASFTEMKALYETMELSGTAGVIQGDVPLSDVVSARYADMRYVGQEHAVTVELPLVLFANEDRVGIKRRFDEVHEQRYGFSSPAENAEIVSLRSAVSGIMSKPPFEKIETGSTQPPAKAGVGERSVYFPEARGYVRTPLFSRTALLARNVIAGPALIEEHASTTVVHPGDRLEVDSFGNLVIEIRRS
jgi:N-methylhydantoinase A